MTQVKDPIKLRKRTTPSGRTSLYLDIYLNGQRSYEYLKLYLVPERNREDKLKNRETLQLAKAICAKRIVELRNGEYGFRNNYKENSLFYDYYVAMCTARLGAQSLGNWGNWRSCLKHLEKYEPRLKELTWKQITQKWCIGFRDYLEHEACAWSQDYRERVKDRPLSRNSQVSYFCKLKACCNQAYDEGIISRNPIRGVEGIKQEEGKRMYLTIEEVQKLADTECHYPSVKKAFLFSCLTGLRRSDILALTWGEVFKQGEFTRIIFKQVKTNGLEYLDLTPEAVELMGKRGNSSDKVFEGIHAPSVTNQTIRRWCFDAGIKKDITFHCARHTFATMMLDLGTDIYTVSKLLGHKEISTTQIYAKVMDKNKQSAVLKIPSILKN